ncbi:MAG TPA: hypothetical protein VK064_06935 [Wenzhouxiangella sp.]|nr:hypothetical protein [Wenzhouxiangella sp.]
MPNRGFKLMTHTALLFVRTSLLAILLASAAMPAAAQDSFSSLEERMTGKEFKQTGLHKLSEDELAALNAWIQARSLAEGEVADTDREQAGAAVDTDEADQADRRGLNESQNDEPIKSRLTGNFDGWSGKTRFELENGMVWQQSDSGSYSVSSRSRPEVTITPGILGSWYLQVDGMNRRVKVKRIK